MTHDAQPTPAARRSPRLEPLQQWRRPTRLPRANELKLLVSSDKMRLKPNAIGLLPLTRRHTHRDTIFAIQTFKDQALVWHNDHGNFDVKTLTHGNFDVKIIKSYPPPLSGRIFRFGDINVSVERLLSFSSRPTGRFHTVTVYRPQDPIPQIDDFIDLTEDTISYPRGSRANVKIGDTIELGNRFESGHREYFSVVGLSLVDEEFVDWVCHDRRLPNIGLLAMSWLHFRHLAAARQTPPQDLLTLKFYRDKFLKWKRNILFSLFIRQPDLIEGFKAASEMRANEKQIRSPSDDDPAKVKSTKRARHCQQKARKNDSDAISNADIMRRVDEQFVKSDLTSRVTIREVMKDVAGTFGLDCFRDKQTKEMIKNRLISLAKRQGRIESMVEESLSNIHERSLEFRAEPAERRGLPNPGNMCYMIVVVQLLYGMKCTREFFSKGDFLKRDDISSENNCRGFGERGGFVAISLHRLFRDMHDPNAQPSTVELKESLATVGCMRELFDDDRQHDASELLTSLLDVFSVALASLGYDFVSDLFGSKVISSRRCAKCDTVTYDEGQPTTHLFVAIDDKETLEECLHDHFHGGDIDEYSCPHCNSKGGKALERSWMTPGRILIITLKRFYAKNLRPGRKIKSTISFPTESLDLSNYVPKSEGETNLKYKLVGVINHEGKTMNSGHYVLLLRRNSSWIKFDDNVVELSSADQLLTNDTYTMIYCENDSYEELVEADHHVGTAANGQKSSL